MPLHPEVLDLIYEIYVNPSPSAKRSARCEVRRHKKESKHDYH